MVISVKKVLVTLVIIVVAIVAGQLFINVYETDTEVTNEPTKVGVVLNGSKSDKSWSQSHYMALEDTAQQLNLYVTYIENVSSDTVAAQIDKLVDKGCEIIIANSATFSEQIVDIAERYPGIYFFHAAGVSEGKNLCSYFGRMYQMRYLTGMVAGMQTETNEIGYVAAYPISEVNRGLNAFTLGVRNVNPEATVYVSWINSWDSDVRAEEAAERLLDKHDIDVLAMHTDSIKPLEVADRHGIMSIGYNLDNSSLFPESCLTAAVWDWEKFYTPQILRCLQGKFEGHNYWEGSESGMINIAPLSALCDAELSTKVESEFERLRSGMFDVFYGPIYDSDSVLRINEGESMTDDAMLNEFDWYVEGVVISEN